MSQILKSLQNNCSQIHWNAIKSTLKHYLKGTPYHGILHISKTGNPYLVGFPDGDLKTRRSKTGYFSNCQTLLLHGVP